MTTWASGLPQRPRVDGLVRAVDRDDTVVGVALTGSWAHAMANEYSDIDLYVIVAEPSDAWRRSHVEGLDLEVRTLAELRTIPLDPARWWDRYSMVRAQVLLDRRGGEIAALFDRWGRLSYEEAQVAIDYYLDPYLAYTDRCLRQHRAQLAVAAHLDAVEGLAWAVRLMFAVHQRVPPTNKYLTWELERFPFQESGWESAVLIDRVTRILATGDADAVRSLFDLLEPALRRRGFGGALDLWTNTLALAHAARQA